MSEERKFIYKIIPTSEDGKGERARKIVLLCSFAVFLASMLVLSGVLIQKAREKAELEQRREAYMATSSVISITQATTTTTELVTEPPPPPPLVIMEQFEALLAENEHTAGWIKVPGTRVNDVVVHTDNNEFYTDHNFAGRKSDGGAIFADFRCIVNDYDNKQSDNIIIYGHNQADLTMFGTLKNYKVKKSDTRNLKFYKDNPIFEFSNLYGDYTYKIIATFVIETEERQTRDGIIFDYHNFIKFSNNAKPPRSFDLWKENVLARTAINTGVDFNENDKYITLSTCSNEFEPPPRLVVIGRRVREGESVDVDTSNAVINENMVEPDYQFVWSR